MYIVKGNYIFFHIDKTGGKSIYEYFLQHNMLEFANEHGKYSDLFPNKNGLYVDMKLSPITRESSLITTSKSPEEQTENDKKIFEQEADSMMLFLEKIVQNPDQILKNCKLFATIRNPIDWYISFYHQNLRNPRKEGSKSYSNICKALSFKEFINEYLEGKNIGLYTKMMCNYTLPININTKARINNEQKDFLYKNFDELCPPITFLKIENIKEEMLKHVPELCSDLENSEFIHVNKGTAGYDESRKKYLEFFDKSREFLLQKEDMLREKDKLIFEKAGY